MQQWREYGAFNLVHAALSVADRVPDKMMTSCGLESNASYRSSFYPYKKWRHRANWTFPYMKPGHTPVKSADRSLADHANKENWKPAIRVVDIRNILQTFIRDTTGTSLEEQEHVSVHAELPEHCQQFGTLPAFTKSTVSKMEVEKQTSKQKAMLPQDMGFPNPIGSNVCWINATLQTLLGMEPFMKQLESSYRKDGRNNQSALLRSFFRIVKHRRLRNHLKLHSALRKFSCSLIKLNAMFKRGMQQDAAKFLLLLLDFFRGHFSSSNSDLDLQDHKIQEICTLRELQLDNLPPGSSPVQQFAGRGRLLGGAVCSNPVCDNVEFCLRETYCCTHCSKYTTGHQDHLALLLNIPPTSQANPSLQDALNHFMQSGVREHECGSCNGQHSKVVTAFTKLPRFLFVLVNRSTYEEAILKKLNTLVQVPINLSVKNHVSDDVIMPAMWLHESAKDGEPLQLSLYDAGVTPSEVEAENESQHYSYRLICIIMHTGASPNCGHFVADVYNLEKQQWYHYNDDNVSQPTEDEVVGSVRQHNGYIFCYMYRPLFNKLSARK